MITPRGTIGCGVIALLWFTDIIHAKTMPVFLPLSACSYTQSHRYLCGAALKNLLLSPAPQMMLPQCQRFIFGQLSDKL